MSTKEQERYLLAEVRDNEEGWEARKADLDARASDWVRQHPDLTECVRCVAYRDGDGPTTYCYWGYAPYARDWFAQGSE